MHLRKMDTRRLHAAEIKQLVRVLRNESNSQMDTQVDLKDSKTEKATVSAIKLLPRRLRANLLSSHGSLCHTHKSLDHHLIDDIWAWIKFELETAIGRFIYPLVMSGTLSKEDEQRIRQLEPVGEMIVPGWTLAESAPPGKRPIHTGTNWAYQQDGCPACMLSRIGSDTKVLFALYAGTYGHLSIRNSNLKKSKRLRIIRYWMRTHPSGAEAPEDAYEFGAKLKASRDDAKTLLRQSGQPVRYKRNSISGPPLSAFPDNHTEIALDVLNPYNPNASTTTSATTSVSTFNPDVSDPYKSKNCRCSTSTIDDPKLGPSPSPAPSTIASIESQTKPRYSDKRVASQATPGITFSPAPEIDDLAPLPSPNTINRTASNRISASKRPAPKRHDSVISNRSSLHAPRPRSSVYSTATSIASYNDPSDRGSPAPSDRSRAFDPLETSEERIEKFRNILAPSWVLENSADEGDDEGSVALEDTFNFRGFLLPKPSRTSLYAAFGDEGKKGDAFEVCDLTPLPSPQGEGFEEGFGEMDGVLVPEGLALRKKV
jgi:hypothetical protein